MALDNQEHAMAVTIEDSGLMDLKKKVTESRGGVTGPAGPALAGPLFSGSLAVA